MSEQKTPVCQTCSSEYLASIEIEAKIGEGGVFFYEGVGVSHVPGGAGIGSISFTYCLDCGQIQGEWPVSEEGMGDIERSVQEAREELEYLLGRGKVEPEPEPEGPPRRSDGELNVIINRLDAEIYEGGLDEEAKAQKIKERELVEQELFREGPWAVKEK